jgi:tetratricopeptide (TPR) repeat protein|tara:strand:- start:206 stop:982 length:777 start_codon:yes stop_codon:yes gene_type:complete
MRKYLILLFSFFSIVLNQENSKTTLEYDLIEKATKFYFSEEYDSSYVYGLEVLNINPDNAHANFYVGDYYGFKGEFEKALDHYNIAINNKPDLTLAYYQRAVTRMILEFNLEFCSDIETLDELITKDPDYNYLKENEVFKLCEVYKIDQPLNDTGIYLAQNGNCGYANLFFNQSLILNPLNDKSYYNLSLCSQGTEREKEFLLKTIEINPKNDGAYRNLGQYYLDKGEKEIAMRYFVKSAQLGNIDVQNWLKSEGHSY